MSISMDMSAFERGTDAVLQFFTVEQARQQWSTRVTKAIRGRN